MSSSPPDRRPAIRPDDGAGQGGRAAYDVGEFAQGSPFSRWALARYLVGRVLLERVSWSLLIIAVVLLVLAAASEIGLHSTFLTVVLVLIALIVLLLRAALRAILRRLMQAKEYGPLEERLNTLVGGASKDVLAELRRVGLPSRLITLPLLATRLVGRRRQDTLARMRQFEVERAVSRARLDELHMLFRQASGSAAHRTSGPPNAGPGSYGPTGSVR